MRYQLQKYNKEDRVNYELERAFVTESSDRIARFILNDVDNRDVEVNDTIWGWAFASLNEWDKKSPLVIYVPQDMYVIQSFAEAIPNERDIMVTDIEGFRERLKFIFKNGIAVSIHHDSQRVTIEVSEHGITMMCIYDADIAAYADEDGYLNRAVCMAKAQLATASYLRERTK